MRYLGASDLEDLAAGAAIVGAGGGGDPYLGKLMAREAIARGGPVALLDVGELDDDDLVIPTAGMGAPTVVVEKVPSGEELARALRALERFLGRRARATMPIEAGGLNSTIPLTLGLPVVDADAMGRAFPELQMVTCTLYGIPACPMALADEKGNVEILNCTDNTWTERLARAATVEVGCTAYIALYPMTGRQVKEAAVPRTLTACLEIGRALRTGRGDPVGAVLGATGGRRLSVGKVEDVRRETRGGFARGEARLSGGVCIQFQNEHLVARLGDRILCSVPDLIALLDAESGEPITTESLRYGFRVAVIGIPCDRRWRSPAGLALAGPRAFGYDFDYVPVEELVT